MKTQINIYFLGIFLVIVLSSAVFAQDEWEWQDPADFGYVDLQNKYAILFNIAGVVLSVLLSEPDSSTSDSGTKWSLLSYAEYSQAYEEKSPKPDIFMAKLRIAYDIRKWITAGTELQLYKMKDKVVSTSGFGLALTFSWTIINSNQWRLSFDNGSGILSTFDPFPYAGTRFNFTTFYGISTELKIKPDSYIVFGLRNNHISNAYLFGDENNPAYDGIGFYIGFKFY
jgi:hypothetical protein